MSTLMSAADKSKVIILPTIVAYVNFQTPTGLHRRVVGRVILDQCSQANQVSEGFVRRNRISCTQSASAAIEGITGDVYNSSSSVHLDIESRYSSFSFEVDANVITRVPYSVQWIHLKNLMSKNSNLKFAESKLPYSDVDILLGAEFIESCFLLELRKSNNVFLRNSQFDWIISGLYIEKHDTSNKFCGLTSSVAIQNQLKKFWEIEEIDVPKSTAQETEHQLCSEFVENTINRNARGRFVAKLLLKIGRDELCNSKTHAEKSLQRIEKCHDSSTRRLYTEFLTEYQELEHMSKVKGKSNGVCYYIPHRAVLRPDSTSTKLRVVFNASAPYSTSLSLNDVLMTGPTIQP